jgi:hypothetical protein
MDWFRRHGGVRSDITAAITVPVRVAEGQVLV